MVRGSCRFWFLTLEIHFPHNRVSKPQPTTSFGLALHFRRFMSAVLTSKVNECSANLLEKQWSTLKENLMGCTQWKTCVCSKYGVLLREFSRLFCLPATFTWCTLHLCAKHKSDETVRVLKFWVRRLVSAFSLSHNLSGFVLISIKGSSSIVWSLKTLEF